MRTAAALALALVGMALIGCGEGQERPVPSLSPVTTTLPSPTPFAATDSPTPSPIVSSATPRDQALVTRVIDGDTIEIEGGERVRYIGMDTPEDTLVGECFGEQATRRNRELVEGRIVGLERDISETDRFGRLLRYVWVGGEMINEVLVDEGFALAATFPPDVKYESTFLLAQRHARAEGLGLWSACVDAGLAPTGPPPSPGGDCDPSYPDVCIPPPPPDLDCADIIYANFRTIGTDPHGFDGNNDGEACER